MHPTILEALRQAESRARERPVSERIQSTKWFVEKKQKRVERAKETVAQAREALAVALIVQEQQEVLLAVAELQEEEKATSSPFKVVPPHALPEVMELQRLQDTIHGLQRQLAKLRAGQSQGLTVMDEDDDDMVAGLPQKRSKLAPCTLLAITSGHAQDLGTPSR